MSGWASMEVTGSESMILYFRGLAARSEDYLLPFEEIIASFHKIEARRFQTGDGWAPLADFTVKKKGHSTILVDTGALEDSLTSMKGFQAISASAAAPFVEVGTQIPYAQYHQHGFVNHWTGNAVPARPVIDITPQDFMSWLEIIARYLFYGKI